MENIRVKSYEELSNSAFYVCNLVDCYNESERLYSTETKLIDVCQKHYDDLMKRD